MGGGRVPDREQPPMGWLYASMGHRDQACGYSPNALANPARIGLARMYSACRRKDASFLTAWSKYPCCQSFPFRCRRSFNNRLLRDLNSSMQRAKVSCRNWINQCTWSGITTQANVQLTPQRSM